MSLRLDGWPLLRFLEGAGRARSGFYLESCLRAGGAARDQRLLRPGVLSLAMSSEVHLALESLLTKATREGFVARMFSHMRDQIGRLAKRLTADHTLMRLLT